MTHLTENLCKINTLNQLQSWQSAELERVMNTVFDTVNLPEPLNAACRYAIHNGGKRVRPLLAAATFISLANLENTDLQMQAQMTLRAMIAVEMIHGYSLVHDDLPCMDDDELRRGKPTCHVVYGEGTALLAGDALQSIAFELLSMDLQSMFDTPHDDGIALQLLGTLAPRARRMVAGQMLDIEGENKTLTQSELEAIHRDKTGALIEASVLMGGICARADSQTMAQLAAYARAVGLAFQVQDDVLDVIADTETLGKPAGSDEKLEKSTYVKLLGVDGAKAYANQLFDDARTAVSGFGEQNLLVQIVDWLQARSF